MWAPETSSSIKCGGDPGLNRTALLPAVCNWRLTPRLSMLCRSMGLKELVSRSLPSPPPTHLIAKRCQRGERSAAKCLPSISQASCNLVFGPVLQFLVRAVCFLAPSLQAPGRRTGVMDTDDSRKQKRPRSEISESSTATRSRFNDKRVLVTGGQGF